MKTLIFNGSPRKNGDTSCLIEKLKERINGEIKTIDAFSSKIMPCDDCRYCWSNVGCCINDEMQDLYTYIKECDNIVIASPIYFGELTGCLLNLFSRLQTFYASKRFLKEQQILKKKLGAIVLCGGGDGESEKAQQTASMILKLMNSEVVKIVQSLDTDQTPSKNDEVALEGVEALAVTLNSQRN
jgi:multimeric flavodoxin WrbA